ncbi:hypothetical protein HNP84_007436 [Thermocatellispora tengchongensis]|uniref:Uncharacterized protein n=1 Tax=Thermocatellispora tengchongensis TaxID=1073253 RepID=A0A840P8J0_9ACTN|nr:hypothetical protein [Thermocatellispora tengchongensis]MBB5137684.1 hypothetical protein [Thermocatellispora tengchongensis]
MFYSQGSKGLARIKSWVLDLADRADRALCMEEDEFAHRIGWTVTRTGFGSRRYRDPRFDLLTAARPAGEAIPQCQEMQCQEMQCQDVQCQDVQCQEAQGEGVRGEVQGNVAA